MGQFERGYGLVIGVGEYSNPDWNVPIAERDAQAIHALLTDPNAGGYPPNQVELLTNAAANSNAVLQALERLATRADQGDTVFIAITSHGALAENNLYTLATSEAEFIDSERIKNGTGLTIVQLANALKTIRAERLLLVINACFAGYTSKLATRGGLREAPSGSVIPDTAGDNLLGSGKGRALITASRADQRSYFLPDDTLSIFGQALSDGLRGVGISDRSGYIGLFELYSRVHQQTNKLAAMRGTAQEPMLSLIDGVGPFPVALYGGAEQQNAELIQRDPPKGMRVIQQTINAQNSQGTIINPSGPVSQTFDNRKVIDFGNAQIGSLKIGDVVQGDLTKTVYNQGRSDDEDDALDPLAELPKIQQRVAVARNVDEFARNNAAFQISQATLALTQNNKALAIQYIDAALPLLDAMNNGYINSASRKLRAVRSALT
jgi:hypothetical protein